jgi:hypothetical protein
MATYTQLPGTLNLKLRAGDDLPATEIDFSISLVGFTVTAPILSTVTGAAIGSLTVAITEAATGKLTVALTDTQTSALAVGTYRWTLVGVSGTTTRTYLDGFLEVVR